MQVRGHDDIARFRTLAEPFLMREPARNQLPIAIAFTAATQPEIYPEIRLWTAHERNDVVGVALRTPPYPVALADPTERATVAALADAIGADDEDAPGVVANRPFSRMFADAWTSRTGQGARTTVAQGVFELLTVRPPRPAAGMPRRATRADAELVHRWIEEFGDEALPEEMAARSRNSKRIDAALEHEGDDGGFWLWELDGDPVSLTGFTTIPVGGRIGPVYTPAVARGRGYASNLVAFASTWLLERGAKACFLYTDLANPTSNKIYTDIGYEQVAESDNIEFIEPDGG